jgi:hypothetical protein
MTLNTENDSRPQQIAGAVVATVAETSRRAHAPSYRWEVRRLVPSDCGNCSAVGSVCRGGGSAILSTRRCTCDRCCRGPPMRKRRRPRHCGTRLRGRREHTKRRNRSSLGQISRSASLRNRPLFSSCHNLPPPSQGIFSTCRGTVRPKNPAASTTAKITTAIIFFIRSFRKALKLNRLPLSLRGEALGPC